MIQDHMYRKWTWKVLSSTVSKMGEEIRITIATALITYDYFQKCINSNIIIVQYVKFTYHLLLKLSFQNHNPIVNKLSIYDPKPQGQSEDKPGTSMKIILIWNWFRIIEVHCNKSRLLFNRWIRRRNISQRWVNVDMVDQRECKLWNPVQTWITWNYLSNP